MEINHKSNLPISRTVVYYVIVKSFILIGPTCVDSAREDPGSCGDRRFDQAFAEHLFEFRLEVKVL